MKVAFATTDGVHVDEHFGRAERFTIYEFTPEGYRNLGMRVFSESRDITVEGTKGQGMPHDTTVNEKVERLSDCGIVYLTSIGGPSAARLANRGIMPVKVPEGISIEELAQKLLETIQTAPPPWLKKRIGDHPDTIQIHPNLG